ncbi:MAG: ATP-binding protein [Pseudomonadales bacterium]
MSLHRGSSSLLARTNLTLAISAALIVLIAILALFYFVIEPIAQRSADDEAALVVLAAQTWVELPPDARPSFELEMAQSHDLILSEDVRSLPLFEESNLYVDLLAIRLSERLDEPVALLQSDELLWVNVPMGGQQLQIGLSPRFQEIQPLYSAMFIIGLGGAVVFVTSLFIVTRVTRPLVLAAERAESFRGAQDFEPLPEQGPKELVSLARNFNTMARDISQLLTNRTTLLAGISHDLRTPLARMRLALELLPDDTDPTLVARMARNLTAMDELIGDALQFARGTQESPQPVDLPLFLEDLLDSYDSDVALTIEVAPPRGLLAAPGALRRVLSNLLENAMQHGGHTDSEAAAPVAIHVRATNIMIADRGPGIPEEHLEAVFQPFFRLDGSRGTSTGGSGLGLAIVSQLCQTHGWQIALQSSPRGTVAVLELQPALVAEPATY